MSKEIKKIYAEKYQSAIRKHLTAMSEKDKTRMEALISAVSYRFSGFQRTDENDPEKDGYIDFITGCMPQSKVYADDHYTQFRCLMQELEDQLRMNNYKINDTLKGYYEIKDYQESKQANEEDYWSWLKTLCKDEDKDEE
jgi:hypothetical protein